MKSKLPYKEAAETVIKIAQHELNKQDRDLVLDDEVKRLYRLLTLYFIDDEYFENHCLSANENKMIPYSLKKGLLIIGSCGRSKTFCFERIFHYFTTKFNPEKKYQRVNAYDIQIECEKKGLEAIHSFKYQRIQEEHSLFYNMYIDEIGSEQNIVNHYGNKIHPLEAFLFERYRVFTRYNKLTHCTTNLTLDQLKENYGDRIYSRLFEMFNIIVTKGTDLRINLI